MRKFYTEPSMSVSVFEAENILTIASGAATGTSTTDSVDTLKENYSVMTLSAGDVEFTF